MFVDVGAYASKNEMRMEPPDSALKALLCEVHNLKKRFEKIVDEFEERIAALEQATSDEELDPEPWFGDTNGK